MKETENTFSMMPDLVSIIVPIYNCESLLPQCIASIIRQTYRNLEIILINDGSTDRSGEICSASERSDSRIRVIHTENRGPAAARNAGIENSRGAFILFLDSDDSLENHAVQKLMECYSRSGADTVIGDFKTVMGGRWGPGHKGVFTADRLLSKQEIMDYTRSYLRKPNRYTLFAYSWGRVFKSSIIRENRVLFDEELHTFEDVAFNFEYMKYADRAYFLGEPIYNHLVHDNYLSATMMINDNPRRMFGYGRALENIGEYLRSSGFGAEITSLVGHAFVCLTIIQCVRICRQIDSKNGKSIRKLVHGAINDPFLRRNLKYYTPTDKDSRVVPLLMKWRLVGPTIYVCRYKAQKRYGKKGAAKWLLTKTPSKSFDMQGPP